jgi:hypothetical protein
MDIDGGVAFGGYLDWHFFTFLVEVAWQHSASGAPRLFGIIA